MKEVLTVRLDPETRIRLESLSGATARSRSYLVSEAIAEYLNANEWQIAAIQEGIRQADAGQVIPHAEVKRKWEKKLAR